MYSVHMCKSGHACCWVEYMEGQQGCDRPTGAAVVASSTHKFGILARDFFCRPPDGMGYTPDTFSDCTPDQ
jgi:hypothetical protein